MLDKHEMEHELSLGHSGYVVQFDDADGMHSTIFVGLVSNPMSGFCQNPSQKKENKIEKENTY